MSSDEICRRVVKSLGVPREVGRWDRAWEMVEGPSRSFLDLLARMDRGEDVEAEAKAAGNALVKAWRAAATAWIREGRP